MVAQAQKLGHINGQLLVEHMPEYKTAYEELNTYKKQYEDALLAMRSEYEKLIEDFKKAEQTAPKVILDTKVKEIQAKEQGIYDFQEQASADVSAEEQRKVEPILEKAKKMIEQVASERGYTHVFDVSAGGMIVFPKGDDITDATKTKMGISLTPANATPAPTGSAPAGMPSMAPKKK